MPRRRVTCSRCGEPADPGEALCGACTAAEWRRRQEGRPPRIVSREDAEAEVARICRQWPELRRRVDVVELDDGGGFAIRVNGSSSSRCIRVGAEDGQSRHVFAEVPA